MLHEHPVIVFSTITVTIFSEQYKSRKSSRDVTPFLSSRYSPRHFSPTKPYGWYIKRLQPLDRLSNCSLHSAYAFDQLIVNWQPAVRGTKRIARWLNIWAINVPKGADKTPFDVKIKRCRLIKQTRLLHYYLFRELLLIRGRVHDCIYSNILCSLPVYLVDLVGIISKELMDSTTSPSLCSQSREFLRNLVALTLKIFTVMNPKFQQDGKKSLPSEHSMSQLNPNHNQFLTLLLKNPSEYCSRPKCPNTSLKTLNSILLIAPVFTMNATYFNNLIHLN